MLQQTRRFTSLICRSTTPFRFTRFYASHQRGDGNNPNNRSGSSFKNSSPSSTNQNKNWKSATNKTSTERAPATTSAPPKRRESREEVENRKKFEQLKSHVDQLSKQFEVKLNEFFSQHGKDGSTLSKLLNQKFTESLTRVPQTFAQSKLLSSQMEEMQTLGHFYNSMAKAMAFKPEVDPQRQKKSRTIVYIHLMQHTLRTNADPKLVKRVVDLSLKEGILLDVPSYQGIIQYFASSGYFNAAYQVIVNAEKLNNDKPIHAQLYIPLVKALIIRFPQEPAPVAVLGKEEPATAEKMIQLPTAVPPAKATFESILFGQMVNTKVSGMLAQVYDRISGKGLLKDVFSNASVIESVNTAFKKEIEMRDRYYDYMRGQIFGRKGLGPAEEDDDSNSPWNESSHPLLQNEYEKLE